MNNSKTLTKATQTLFFSANENVQIDENKDTVETGGGMDCSKQNRPIPKLGVEQLRYSDGSGETRVLIPNATLTQAGKEMIEMNPRGDPSLLCETFVDAGTTLFMIGCPMLITNDVVVKPRDASNRFIDTVSVESINLSCLTNLSAPFICFRLNEYAKTYARIKCLNSHTSPQHPARCSPIVQIKVKETTKCLLQKERLTYSEEASGESRNGETVFHLLLFPHLSCFEFEYAHLGFQFVGGLVKNYDLFKWNGQQFVKSDDSSFDNNVDNVLKPFSAFDADCVIM